MEENNILGDNSLLGQNYNLPENREEFIDTKSGEIVKKEKIEPMDVIRKIAEKIGTKIQDPKPGCKHCYGRGWIGRDAQSKAPIPCNCIYPKVEGEEAIQRQLVQESMRKLSSKERRRLEQYAKRQKKKKNKREWQNKQKKKKKKK